MKKRLFSLALMLSFALQLFPAGTAARASSGAVFRDSGVSSVAKLSQAEISWLLADNPSEMPVSEPSDIFEEMPSVTPPYAPGKVNATVLQAASNRLNALRQIAGLPAVALDPQFCEDAQYGAVLIAVSEFAHEPTRPSDMEEAFYTAGLSATRSSNLSAGRLLTETPDGFMDDSDASNISTVGHRRWQLYPSLGKVGFGFALNINARYGRYTAEKVFDSSAGSQSYDFIGWPSSGYFPNSLFRGSTAWSITLNPDRYTPPTTAEIGVTLTRASDGTSWYFSGAQTYTPAAQGPYFKVDRGGFGVSNCIIFRPDGVTSYNGVYTVSVTGLKDRAGNGVNFAYQVEFFDPAAAGGDPSPSPAVSPLPTETPSVIVTPLPTAPPSAFPSPSPSPSSPAIGLTASMFNVGLGDETYDGEPKKKDISGKYEGLSLQEGVDYTVTFSNNIEPGNAEILIRGINRFSGSLRFLFVIQPARRRLTSGGAVSLTLNGAEAPLSFTDNAAADQPSYTFASSDPSVVLVDASGRLRAVGVGSASVTVSAPATPHFASGELSVPVTVSGLPLQELSFSTSGTVAKTFGDLPFSNAASNRSLGGGAVRYDSSDENVATVSAAGEVRIQGVGSAVISAIAAAVPGVYQETKVSYVLRVERAQQSIRFTVSGVGRVFGDPPFTIAISMPDPNLTVSYSSSDPSVALIDGRGEVTIMGAGTTEITATSEASASYVASTASYTLTVDKAGQPVSFPEPLLEKTYGDASFQLRAISNGDGEIRYASSTPSVAEVSSSGTVTIRGAGTATISASADEGKNYRATVTPGTCTIQVSPAPQQLELNDLTVPTGGDPVELSTAVQGKHGDLSFALAGGAGRVSGTLFYPSAAVGSALVRVTSGPWDENGDGIADYQETVETFHVTIADKTPRTLRFAEHNVTKIFATDTIYTQTAALSAGAGDISYSSSAPSVAAVDSSTGQVRILSYGSAVITASISETDSYLAATDSYTLTVQKKQISKPQAIQELRYTGAPLTGVPAGEGYSVSGGTETNPGSYTAVATLTDGYQWNDGTEAPASIPWSIERSASPAAPANVKGLAPSSAGGTDGKLSGTTAAMEYSSSGTFENALPCGEGTTTGTLPAGTYYVRLKATDTTPAGNAVTVIIPAYSKFILTVEGGEGSGEYDEGESVAISALDVEGKRFKEWDGLNVLSVTAGSKTTQRVTFPMPGRDLTVTAIYEGLPLYTITFQPGGGSVQPNSAVTDDKGKLSTLPTPTRSGYAFTGWYTASTGGTAITTAYVFTADTTIYAQWNRVQQPAFSDIHAQDYFYDAVLWATEREITTGTSQGVFSPGESCSRAQTVTFLWRACGKPEPVMGINPFHDVDTEAYYYKAVLWAVQSGITMGTGNGGFSPTETVTRGQVVTFLHRAMQSPWVPFNNSFSDVNAAAYYATPVSWAVQAEITNGVGGGRFAPEQACRRSEIVTFLYRCYSRLT